MNALRESKFPKFSGGACPQTPLGGLWAYAHSIIVITVHDQRSEPPHLYYLFSALVYVVISEVHLQLIIYLISVPAMAQ